MFKHSTRGFQVEWVYNRFVELMSEILEPLAAFMQSRCGQSRGIAFVDSTPLRVCENIRIPRHKTFKEQAGRAKSSTGWFYGFKLHFMINDCGEILSFCLTRGNVDDRTPVPNLVKRLIGKLFGDRGYVSKKLTELLADQNVELITTLKKNMKPKVIAAFDKLILRKRSIIETINDQLKNTFNLEHSRHRSLRNFVVNAIACLVAYSYQKKKPSLNINHADLLPFVQ
ncbi:MAG: IS982 family transposase [Gallionella sp.]|nr:IS982 family transposase [Gallionella sp.]